MVQQGLSRDEALGRLRQHSAPWQILVIGGGATGIAIALDAASRGLDVVLVEQSDFGKGTSSRSTKLVHGGVRYLRQGNITLVRDALRERTRLRDNAPHLVHDMPFLIPCRSMWQRFFYGVGLKLYDFLSVRSSFGRSHGVSTGEAIRRVPVLKQQGLRGGVIYHDGQFDDTRLLINMARTAHDHGACLINYVAVTGLEKDADGRLTGATLADQETGDSLPVRVGCVINAAGPFCDAVRRLDQPDCETLVAASQGVHLVLPRRFFPSDTAMIVPKTSDGRVIFIIPWHQHAVVGTTDTPIPEATLEPTAQQQEIDFLLATAADYLETPAKIDDVLSVFTGIRPLVKADKSARTASLSRDHTIRVSPSGLITITGGKWTTVRKMAEDCVDRAVREIGAAPTPSTTAQLPLHGSTSRSAGGDRAYYGADLVAIETLEQERPELAQPLHRSLPIRRSDIVWAVRHEMARTVEDVLARRTRILFLDAKAAIEMAPEVARVMASELDTGDAWCDQQVRRFEQTANHYLPR